MQNLSMAAAGAVFIALANISTASAQVARLPLQFSFTTESGRTGSFTLDINTARDPNPALLLNPDKSVFAEGILYPNAVSNFSFSAPDVNLSNIIADYAVFPTLNAADFISSASTGDLSSVGSPSGCIVATDFFCAIQIFVEYSGSVPVLSADPLSYPTASSIFRSDPITGAAIGNGPITNFRVAAVPEPDFSLGLLAFGIGYAGLLLKHKIKMNRKGAAISPDFSPV